METLQRTANRGSISTGFDIDNSLKLEADNSEYISRTPSSAGNRKTWTLSFWLKRTELGASMRIFEAWDGSTGTSALFTDTDLFILDLNAGSNYFTSSAVFRDTSAWYHFVIRVDTTSGTASERARVYVNGSELAGSWNSNIGQNTDLTWNQNVAHNFARFHNNDSFVSGYYAEIINVDGTSLAPTAFGEFDSDSGIWKPKNASVTYGTNGFKLEFKSSGSLGADTSGNGHTWTLNNITSADQATDTPTNNFAINNIIDGGVNTSNSVSYKEGGTVQIRNQNTNYNYNFSTLGMTKGKWYAEFQRGNSSNIMIGVQLQNFDSTLSSRVNVYIGQGADNHGGAFSAGGAYFYNNTASTGHTAYGTSDILGVAVDCDNNKIYFSVNGTYVNSGNPASGSNGFDFGPLETNEPCFFVMNSYSPNLEHKANFGGYTTISIASGNSDDNGYGTFEYAPPSGYYALCTKNLAEYG